MKKIIFLILLIFFAGCTEKLDEDAIYVVTMGPGTMREQFLAGNIDGFIAWEPYNADLALTENADYLIHSDALWPNHPCCVLSTISTNEDAITAMVWTHIKSIEFLNNIENKEKILEYAKLFTGKDRSVVKEALDHIEFIEYPKEQELRLYYEKLKTNGILTNTIEDLNYVNEEDFFDDFLLIEYYQNVKNKLNDDPNWTPKKVPEEIKLSYLTGDLHQLAFFIAQQEGYYDQVFENIEFIQFKNGPATMDGFSAELMDFGYLGGAPATLKRINTDTRIQIIAGANNHGSAIVVNKDIKNLADLKGKVIATPGFGTVQDFILRMAAQEAGLKIMVK